MPRRVDTGCYADEEVVLAAVGTRRSERLSGRRGLEVSVDVDESVKRSRARRRLIGVLSGCLALKSWPLVSDPIQWACDPRTCGHFFGAFLKRSDFLQKNLPCDFESAAGGRADFPEYSPLCLLPCSILGALCLVALGELFDCSFIIQANAYESGESGRRFGSKSIRPVALDCRTLG